MHSLTELKDTSSQEHTMWAPEQCLPPPLPEATVTDLLTSINLPELLSLHQLNTRAVYHSMYMPPDAL